MDKGSHIFGQLLQIIDWNQFSKTVDKYNGDKGAKGVTCRSHFTSLLFGHIAGADSLREISQGMQTLGNNLNHMAVSRVPSKSSLSYANEKRDWRIYRDTFNKTVSALLPKISKRKAPKNYKGKIFSVDSTTIDLCLNLFPWAKFHHRKGAVKIHTLLDHDALMPVFADVTPGNTHDSKAFKKIVYNKAYHLPKDSIVVMDRAYVDYALFGKLTSRDIWFVTRMKENAQYEIVQDYPKPQNSNVISDQIIQLNSLAGEKCEYYLRKVVVFDEENNHEIEFITNNLKFGATTISAMYKDRWQIELFFKQIKQNLKIRSFLGTSENAVKTQIYCALTAIVLLQYLKSVSDSKREQCKEKTFSFSNMVLMLRVSLFRTVELNTWLMNPYVPLASTPPNYQLKMDFIGQHISGGG